MYRNVWVLNYSVNTQTANVNMRVMQQRIIVTLNVKSNKKYSKAIFRFRIAVLLCPSGKVYTGPDTGNKCKQPETLNYKLRCCDMCKGYVLYFSILIPQHCLHLFLDKLSIDRNRNTTYKHKSTGIQNENHFFPLKNEKLKINIFLNI